MGPISSERFRRKKSNGIEEGKSNAENFRPFIFLLATFTSDVHTYIGLYVYVAEISDNKLPSRGPELGEWVNNSSSIYLRNV